MRVICRTSEATCAGGVVDGRDVGGSGDERATVTDDLAPGPFGRTGPSTFGACVLDDASLLELGTRICEKGAEGRRCSESPWLLAR